MFLYLVVFVALQLIYSRNFVKSQESLDFIVKESQATRLSLAASSWPADHGDVARSKFTLNYGLPNTVSNENLQMMVQTESKRPQWLYTYGNNSEYLFVISSDVSSKTSGLQIQKLSSVTMELLQSYKLDPAIYLGGLLMHKNGHVYAVHGNVLYKFNYGDLSDVIKIRLPTRLNGYAVSTNGMLVTSDGYLVIKQWSFLFVDIMSIKVIPNKITGRVFMAVLFTPIVLAITIAFLRHRKSSKFSLIVALLINCAIALTISLIVTVTVVTKSFAKRINGPFSTMQFITTNLLKNDAGGRGELKIIDPNTLAIVADYHLPERCSYARMAIFPVFENDHSSPYEDAIVLLGDEHVYQLRWRYSSRSLRLLNGWTKRYRHQLDGSYPGTGPAIYNNTVYFTDNTCAGLLFGRTFRLFRVPLIDKNNKPCSGFDRSLPSCPYPYHVHLTKDRPGFFYFSAVISPRVGDVIVWDTSGRSLQARHLDDLSLHWEVKLSTADCVTVAVNQGHVYATDYSHTPTTANEWMSELVSEENEKMCTHSDKHFVVINAMNGTVIANKTIEKNQKLFPSMIIAGGNNDAFIGTNQGIVRLYVN